MTCLPPIVVTDEVLNHTSGDLVAQIQRARVEAFIDQQIQEAIPVLGEDLARELYRPTAFEGPS